MPSFFKLQFQNSRDETSQSVYVQNVPLYILNTCCNIDVTNLYVSAKITKLYILRGFEPEIFRVWGIGVSTRPWSEWTYLYTVLYEYNL